MDQTSALETAAPEAASTQPAAGTATVAAEHPETPVATGGPATPDSSAPAGGADGAGSAAPPIRRFFFNGQSYRDPDPKLSVDEVRRMLADYEPDLVNADTEDRRVGAEAHITFRRRVGTKGRCPCRQAGHRSRGDPPAASHRGRRGRPGRPVDGSRMTTT